MRNILNALYNNTVPMKFVGDWDASIGYYPTNAFRGAVYRVSVSADIGSPPISYIQGDYILYDGTQWLMLSSVTGSGGGISVTWELKTASFTVVNGGHYLVDTTPNGSPVTQIVATCPPLVSLDDTFYVRIKDASGNFDTSPLLIESDDNSSPYEYTVMGYQSVEVDLPYADLTLAYDTTNNKIII